MAARSRAVHQHPSCLTPWLARFCAVPFLCLGSFAYKAGGGGGYATVTDMGNGTLRASWDIDVSIQHKIMGYWCECATQGCGILIWVCNTRSWDIDVSMQHKIVRCWCECVTQDCGILMWVCNTRSWDIDVSVQHKIVGYWCECATQNLGILMRVCNTDRGILMRVCNTRSWDIDASMQQEIVKYWQVCNTRSWDINEYVTQDHATTESYSWACIIHKVCKHFSLQGHLANSVPSWLGGTAVCACADTGDSWLGLENRLSVSAAHSPSYKYRHQASALRGKW